MGQSNQLCCSERGEWGVNGDLGVANGRGLRRGAGEEQTYAEECVRAGGREIIG